MVGNFFYGQYVQFIAPNDFQFPTFIFLLMIVVAGGPGSVWGCTIGTTLLILLREGLRFLPLEASLVGPIRLMLFGVILLTAVWIRKDTLFPAKRSV